MHGPLAAPACGGWWLQHLEQVAPLRPLLLLPAGHQPGARHPGVRQLRLVQKAEGPESQVQDAAEEKRPNKETESQRFKSTASSKVLRGQNTSNLERHLEAARPEVSERVQGMYFIIIPFKSARPMMHIYML